MIKLETRTLLLDVDEVVVVKQAPFYIQLNKCIIN